MSLPPSLEVRLLGRPSALRDGRPAPLRTRKTMALLAILASRPGTVFPRERLADLLWPRSAGEQARASLRQALAQLRKALGDDGATLIEAGNDGLRLAPERVGVDVVDFETALEAALATDDPVELGRAARRAADLYAGEFLDGFVLNAAGFGEWRLLEAERLRRKALAGFVRLMHRHVEHADVDAATALGERLLALDPASEDTFQALMRLHIERGALGSAMREYERCKAALASELGVPPSAATEALRKQIRAHPAAISGADTDSVPLIAVLPFSNLSDDPSQGYFARGFTEDVIRELARFRPLRVIAAQSSFGAADPHTAPHEIGARLGARYLLSGSVRRTPGSIRIGTELLDTATGHFMWSSRYDIEPQEIFAAQDEIARAVAATLAARIDDDRRRQAARKPLENLAAYDCWLRGVACLRSGTPDSPSAARPLFERALEIDPGFARAYSGLSLSWFNEWSCLAWEHWAENERRAFDYAQRAAAMDDGDPVTHFILARILLYRREFERAERHLERAELLNPNDADTLAQLAVSDMYLGHAERGVERIRLAMRLNPFHDDWYFAFAAVPHLFAQRFDAAVEFGLKAPNVATDVHAHLAVALAYLGRADEARRHVAQFLQFYRRNITFGKAPAPGEAARWLLHVNPFRRTEDTQFFLDGLLRAGLDVAPELQRPDGART